MNISTELIVGISLGFEILDNVEAMDEQDNELVVTLLTINLLFLKITIMY
jgi:hypothetical protein